MENQEPRNTNVTEAAALNELKNEAKKHDVDVAVKNTFLTFGSNEELGRVMSRRRTTMTRVRRSGAHRVSFCPEVPVFFYNLEQEAGDGEWFDNNASDSSSESDENEEQNELTDTTVMIRNIPNKYTQRRMLAVLEEHNVGKFNYLYMPMDLRHKCNVGYGFINFLDPRDAAAFKDKFTGFKLPDTNSKKIFEVSFAKTQGLRANILEVKNRAGASSRPIPEDYKPLFFDENMGEIPMPEV